MPDLPPLDCLRFFDAAARHRSFARAAEELGVTPAAVAYRIRVLERHLRAPLFSRHARSVRLTEPGSRYHADIQRVLVDVLTATRRFRRSRIRRRPTARDRPTAPAPADPPAPPHGPEGRTPQGS